MKTVISASRRTDLPACFPEWLAAALKRGRVRAGARSRRAVEVDLRPEAVHTLVLWSKDFGPLLRNAHGLRDSAAAYDQLYLLFTVTGLGGTPIEPGVPPAREALAQLPELVRLAGAGRRVSLRFDPVVFWTEGGGASGRRSNLDRFEAIAEAAARVGVEDIRFSVTQWYGKAVRRAGRRGFAFVDPEEGEKLEAAARLAETARRRGLRLHSCSQLFLTRVPGVLPSACIDGRLLAALHPSGETAPEAKDRSQRPECGCTRSVDIGSYAQACPHACVYCYANR